jgi:DNA-binding MarR family transcriptional regulator
MESAGHRLSPRRWKALSFLAVHGNMTVMLLADQTGVSRVTAHRDLAALYAAGLVERHCSVEDRTHTWVYSSTRAGNELVAQRLRAAGRPVPMQLERRYADLAHWLLFEPLVAVASRHPDRCRLLRWLPRMDTSVWLREHRLTGLRADSHGVWLQDGKVVRFLVHVESATGETTSRAAGGELVLDMLAGYREHDGPVPVGAILLIMYDEGRESDIHGDLNTRPLQARFATTTVTMLGRRWPTDAIWRAVGSNDERIPLIGLADR